MTNINRQENIDAFRGGLKAYLKKFDETPPKHKLVALENGDKNIQDERGVLLFKDGAKADAERIFKVHQKVPNRILFGNPLNIFSKSNDDAERDVRSGDFKFETQKYDDVNKDVHIADFNKSVYELIQNLKLKITDKTNNSKPYFVVCYGLGLGHQLRFLWDTYKPKNLIVLESELDLFNFSLDEFDWKALIDEIRANSSSLTLIIDSDKRDMLTRLNGAVQGDCIIGLDGLVAFKFSNHPVINVVFSEFQSSKTGSLASYMGYIVDEYNMMKNSFRNLRTGNRRLLNIARYKPNLPILIVGSGPSLEKNIEFIKTNRNKFILMASGSSLAVLLKNGIYPNFQAVLERAKGNYERHVELANEFNLKKIVAVLTTTIWPGTADFFKDAIFFLRPALSPLAVFCHTDAEVLNGEGPQVTNTAFAFSARVGFKEIYLLGVDLGARDPNKGRAERAWLSPGLKQRELTIPVRGNFGKTVFTDNALIQQRVTIENQINKITKNGAKVYNLGDGVKINFAVPLMPEKVVFEGGSLDLDKEVDEITKQFPVLTKERFISDWESSEVRLSVAKFIRAISKEIAEAKDWSHSLIKKIEIINQYNGKPVKQQYAPRLLRGSILRMAILTHSIMMRVEEGQAKNIFESIKPIWLEMLSRLESEAYELADELESEDDYFMNSGKENLAV